MTRVAIYSRVSTSEQDCENQLRQLRQYCEQQGWMVVREYTDRGESGSNSSRPQFQQLLTDASRRKFDMVMFWALDRLSREGVLRTLHYLNWMESYQVAWRSFSESYFDSCGPFKDAVISIMATLAKQERLRISERTRAGLAIARARGKILGRPKTLTATPRDVLKLRSAGKSYRAVGRELGISFCSAYRLAHSAVS